MTWKRTSSHFIQVLAVRRRRTLLNNALHSWMHFTFENLLIANAKFQSDLLDAKAQCEVQKNQTTAVDVENLQLIDRLHAMSSDIAHLKITICEKGKLEEELHQSIEDTAVIQSTMRAELEQQHLQIEDLELQSITFQNKLQSQNAKEHVCGAQHVLEIEGLEKAIKTLQIQIEERSKQIESYAKALKDTAQKLEGTSDESQEQLSNAFEIAGSLRKILDDRESQFATLEGNCRRRELELGELRRKLASSNDAFSETIETRDAKIRELEGMLAQKQNEVQDTQQEMQDFQSALHAKESLVRKLEYEMRLKSDTAASQVDVLAGFQTNAHSIQMESMKHVYMQTKAALQQGLSPDHCVSGYRLSAFKVQTKPSSSAGWRLHGASSPLQEKRDCGSMLTDCGAQSRGVITSILDPLFRDEALSSFPPPCHGLSKDGADGSDHDEAKRLSKSDSSRSSNVRHFLEPVDSLHVEIQQLQARILERMKLAQVAGSSKS